MDDPFARLAVPVAIALGIGEISVLIASGVLIPQILTDSLIALPQARKRSAGRPPWGRWPG